ncbi:hypothetical protein TDB9533_04760 [Thalassocella blandensis]|nr:hypothetical protein TDB9533_04760 [Thalassocella blandensis]
MKCLNEPVARQANKEDGCTGRFWEGRFKSQALLSQEALLSCMAYVDLNPIRAQIARTPESSDHTSIKERIKPSFELHTAIHQQQELGLLNTFNLPLKPLAKFEGNITNTKQSGVLFSLHDYLSLVDMTGRILRNYKRGGIPSSLPPILHRLNIDTKDWLINASAFEKKYQTRFAKQKRRKTASI